MQTRRALLATAGVAAVSGLAGCTGSGGDGTDDNRGADGGNTPKRPVATAPVPDETGGVTYARMDAGAPTTVTYVGNWKCPFCAEFSNGSDRVLSLGEIVSDYVVPGDIAVEYRALCYTGDGEPFLGPDAPRAGRAGLAVWNVDPASYWRFHEQVMADQPPEDEEWATRSRLVGFARDAGVGDPDAVGSAVADGSHETAVRANTEFAASAGVDGTPSLVVGDAAYSPFEPDALQSALDTVSG